MELIKDILNKKSYEEMSLEELYEEDMKLKNKFRDLEDLDCIYDNAYEKRLQSLIKKMKEVDKLIEMKQPW